MKYVRVAMAQIDSHVGNFDGNADKICSFIEKARLKRADIVAFPEMAITGYPPEDLLLKPQFVKDSILCLQRVVDCTTDIVAVVGFVNNSDGKIYNSAAVIYNKKLCGIYRKTILPNYGVFDEKRYFEPGDENCVFLMDTVSFGVNICEDIWHESGPCSTQAKYGGASLIININSSPYHAGKGRVREEIVQKRAKDCGVYIAYTNMVGGQDELVFDGGSFIVDPEGNVVTSGKQFEEDLIVADLPIIQYKEQDIVHDTHENFRVSRLRIPGKAISDKDAPVQPEKAQPLSTEEETYRALLLGTKDYVLKNNFKKVVIGLSGGIDSALTAVIAADALGTENVVCVFMPSRYSSEESLEDAQALCENLGIKFVVVPIQTIFETFIGVLKSEFKDSSAGIAEENLQARIRGNILMALSNKFGWLVLTTGNKSEMSTGYATLYGDMAGGFAVIKDVLKTVVYNLALYRNSKGGEPVIPERIITKEPTAELGPNQKDTDTLPPYPALDPILKAYVEEDKSPAEIIGMGHDRQVVARVVKMVDASEYKRRQAPPGVKITPKAFGKDWRVPITNGYRGI
jgi:NAD+ synthase (glutamine-hydrolysing)